MTFQIKKHHQRYTAYQDTGIPWLGEVPEGWKNGRVKNIKAYMYYPIGDGDHGSIKPDMYEESGIPYIRVQNLSWGTDLKDKGLVCIPLDVHRKNMKSCLRPKDILIAKTGATVGKTATIPESIAEANTTSSVGKVTVDHKNYDYRYFCYVFRSKQLQEQIWELSIQKSAQPGFNIDDLIDFAIPIPPTKGEQTTIANYLDEKTDLIDQTITAKKRQIELLKEKRSSLINRAVTRGIEEGVEMKETGLKWLPKYNSRYELLSLKKVLETPITDGPHETPELIEDAVPFVSAEAICPDGTINFNKRRGDISETLHHLYCKKCKPQKNDVFVVKSGSTTGRVALVETEEEFSIWSPLALIRCNPDKAYFKYIFYSLQSDFFQKQVQLFWSFGTQPNIGMGVLGNLKVILPKVQEQQKIVNYLDTETTKIDQTIALVEKSISLLEEYKTSLISNVVTGKIKVC